MDLSTILGIIAGISLIVGSIVFGEGGSIHQYINASGLCIVLGGISASTLISYPLDEVISVFQVARKVFSSHIKEPTILMLELMHLAATAKKEGSMLKLPEHAKKLKDPFLSKGVQMLADNIPLEEIVGTLDTEILLMQTRHKLGRDIFSQMAKLGPAYGMIGTLIGLVQLLSNLKEADKVGPAMSVALLTTFYGAVSANLFFMPISNKLKRRSEQEFLNMQISKEAIMAISTGESITLMQDKLSSFISRSLQQALSSRRQRTNQDTSDNKHFS